MSELLGDAERVVERARSRGAEAAEAFVLASKGGGVRVQKNDLNSVESETSRGIGIRVLKEKRVGFAYVTGVEQASKGIAAALEACRLSLRLPTFAFAEKAKAPRVSGLFDVRLEAIGGPESADVVDEMVRAVKDVDASLDVTEAGFSRGSSEVAIANSEGVAVTGRDSRASASCFVVCKRKEVSTGFATQDSNRFDLDAQKLGREAADLALRAQDPKPFEKGGKMDLLLRPEPAGDLFETITVPNLYGKAAHRDESFYTGKVGRRVAHASISLLDDATRAGGLGSFPFDDEGVPSRAFRPIAKGVLKGFYFDVASGAEFHRATTASALRVHAFDGRSHKSPPVASGRNLVLEAPKKKLDRLVADIDDGLLIHDLMGVHTANTVSGDFSVTSSTLFRIRKGAIEEAVAPVSVAGNFHAALKTGFTLADDVKRIGGEAALEIPSVRFTGFTVTP